METGKEVAIKIIENLAENIREVSIEIIIVRKIMSNLFFFGNDLMENISIKIMMIMIL